VFVDFTAAWCITCQINKRATLGDADVLQTFRANDVLLLRADWTRRDPAITEALRALGRSGVPVYAFYAPGAAAPQLLSEILTVSEVRAAVTARSARSARFQPESPSPRLP
jgi:thiol:disulfide interchange protein